MPMMRYEAKLAGGEGEAFAHLPPDLSKLGDRLADDGVSCSVCHQITDQNLGKRESFVGGFKIDEKARPDERHVYGQFDVKKGHTTIMKSSSTFQPIEKPSTSARRSCAPRAIRSSRQALDSAGQGDRRAARTGAIPGMAAQRLQGDTKLPVLSHAGREGRRADHVGLRRAPCRFFAAHVRRRQFLHAADAEPVPQRPVRLGAAPGNGCGGEPDDCAPAIGSGQGHVCSSVDVRNGRLDAAISVENLGGHKLPTAYPSRRVWLHVTVRDRNGKAVFESGALNPNGAIQGNDNDEDGSSFRTALHRDHPAGSGADLRERHGGRRRCLDHGTADGCALREGQSAASARIRQAHGGEGRGRARRRGSRRGLCRRRRPDSNTRSPWETRGGRSRWKPSCGINRSPIAGR